MTEAEPADHGGSPGKSACCTGQDHSGPYHHPPAPATVSAPSPAVKAEGVAVRHAQGVPKAWISKRVGGDQIDYADESAQVRQWFAEALARHELKPRMDEAYQAELAELPPKVSQAA